MNIKTIKYSLFALIVVLFNTVITSCGEDYSSPLKGCIINEQSIGFDSGRVPIIIGNKDLKNCAVSCNAEWCRVSIDGNSVIINVDANITYENRETIITLTDMEDSTTISFKVVQLAKEVVINEKSTYEIPYKGGQVEIKIQSNANYSVEIPSDAVWLSYTSTRGLTESSITLKAETNNSGSDRKTTVKLIGSTSNILASYQITQFFNPYIKFDEDWGLAYENGGEKDIKLFTNIPSVNIKAESNSSWIQIGDFIKEDQLYIQKIKVSPLKDGENERTGTVTLTHYDTNWSRSATYTIIQRRSLYITSSNVRLKVGETYQLQYKINLSSSGVWSSSNKSVATVNEDGLVKGIGKGTATITLSSKDGQYSDAINVMVEGSTKPDNPNEGKNGPNVKGYCSMGYMTGMGWFITCTLENNSKNSITVNKCSLYMNNTYQKTITDGLGTLGSGRNITVRVSNVSSGTYTFVWEYTYDGNKYTCSCSQSM